MSNQELINTLKKAAKGIDDNIPLQFLLLMAAERIETLTGESE